MSNEDRLRDALHAEAARVHPRDGWAEIEGQILAPVRRGPTRAALAAAAAAVLAATIALVSVRDDPQSKPLVTAESTTSTSAASSTTTAGPATSAPPPPTSTPTPVSPQYIWPFDNARTYNTPGRVADAFARDFLGMPSPRLGAYRAGDSRSGEIDVFPSATGTMHTTLTVRQDAAGWHVVTAATDHLELDTPSVGATIRSPVHLSGRSIAFEGTVRVAVLRYGTTMRCTQPTDSCGSDHGVLANTYFTGGGTEKTPFETDVAFKRSSTRYGLVVLFVDSAENGTLSEATVRLVRFG